MFRSDAGPAWAAAAILLGRLVFAAMFIFAVTLKLVNIDATVGKHAPIAVDVTNSGNGGDYAFQAFRTKSAGGHNSPCTTIDARRTGNDAEESPENGVTKCLRATGAPPHQQSNLCL